MDKRPTLRVPPAVTVLSKRRVRSAVELVVTVAVAVGVALAVQAWVVKPYKIPSASMEPTLTEGQRVLVDRLFESPHVGEIVVFHPPREALRASSAGARTARPPPATGPIQNRPRRTSSGSSPARGT